MSVVTAVYAMEIILGLTSPALPTEFWSLILGNTPITPAPWFAWVFCGVLLLSLVLLSWTALRTSRNSVAVSVTAAILPALAAAAYYPLQDMVRNWVVALACVPSTVFGVLILSSAQRFSRIPRTAVLMAFAWGSMGAYGLASLANDMALRTTVSTLVTSQLENLTNGVSPAVVSAAVSLDLLHVLAWHAGILEELVKATGVALLLFLVGRKVQNVVSGTVLGGIVGLGFNFSESVRYISSTQTPASHWDAGSFQYWMRQSVGLLGAHTAFSAVAGAGLAVAASSKDPRRRAQLASAGLVAAIGSHVANDTLPSWFSQVAAEHGANLSDTWGTLVLSPLFILVIQFPMIVVYVLLLRSGLREQAAGFAQALAAEAASGAGAISSRETPVLANPAARVWVVVKTAREYGLAAALALRQLHATQLELARYRWQHIEDVDQNMTPGADVRTDRQLNRLRQQVLHRKEQGLGPALAGAV